MNSEITQTENTGTETAEAIRVSIVSIIVNIVLSALKLIAGIIAGSGAMISDAVHSASDVFSTFVVIAGVKLADKKPDKEHPYGHERMECVAAVILAVVLAGTGIGIGLAGIRKIASANREELAVPGVLALIAAVVSVIVKEAMFHYTKHTAKKIASGALLADAWHHRSDALSSVGSFAGILGALSFSMTFHAFYNLLVSEPGIPSYLGYASPLICAVLLYFIDRKLKLIEE